MIRRPLLLLLLCLALLATPALPRDEPEWTARETEELVQLATEYLGLTDLQTEAKDRILEQADLIGVVSERRMKDVVKALFKVARSGPKSDGKGECAAKFAEFPGRYYLSGAGGGKKGIFIGLHGGGPGVGDGRTAQSLWGAATAKGLIGVFPTANLEGRQTTWQSPEVEAFVMAVIRELKRTYKIDTNRIYVAGHSLGGSGAFHIGLRNADLLAAVSPNAGGLRGILNHETGESSVPGGYVANLYHTPTFITHFDRDPRVFVHDSRAVAKELDELEEQYPDGYEHRYVEGEGEDHGFPPKAGPPQIIAWMTKFKRDPYPKRLIWEPTNPRKRLFSWLRHGQPTPSLSRRIRIVATCDENRIEVTGQILYGISILLSKDMFDPAKPVTLVVNEETVSSEILIRRPAALLESILENIDPEQVFEYRLDLP
jgi:dienelactone hydrolase